MDEEHKSQRSAWLRAAVLGANDGIVSTAGIMIGVATATADQTTILTAGIAGLVAGALSMAAGEYVSVSSQRDSERSDIALEKQRLEQDGERKQEKLAAIYESRGLDATLARQVAQQLHKHNALEAHVRDELGLDHEELSNPFQAAVSSATAFTVGALFPIIAALVWHGASSVVAISIVSMLALGVSGAVGAYIGGGDKIKAALRVFIGGGLAMLISGIIGHLVGGVV